MATDIQLCRRDQIKKRSEKHVWKAYFAGERWGEAEAVIWTTVWVLGERGGSQGNHYATTSQ